MVSNIFQDDKKTLQPIALKLFEIYYHASEKELNTSIQNADYLLDPVLYATGPSLWEIFYLPQNFEPVDIIAEKVSDVGWGIFPPNIHTKNKSYIPYVAQYISTILFLTCGYYPTTMLNEKGDLIRFDVSKMPKNIEEWPQLSTIIHENRELLSEDSAKAVIIGIQDCAKAYKEAIYTDIDNYQEILITFQKNYSRIYVPIIKKIQEKYKQLLSLSYEIQFEDLEFEKAKEYKKEFISDIESIKDLTSSNCGIEAEKILNKELDTTTENNVKKSDDDRQKLNDHCSKLKQDMEEAFEEVEKKVACNKKSETEPKKSKDSICTIF